MLQVLKEQVQVQVLRSQVQVQVNSVFIVRQYVAFWTSSGFALNHRHRPIVRTFENTVLATWRQVPDPQVQVQVL